MEKVQVYLTTPQKNKFEKGQSFQLSHAQLEAGQGQHKVEIHLGLKEYRDLLKKASSKKGFRFDPSKVQGGSILESFTKTAKATGRVAKRHATDAEKAVLAVAKEHLSRAIEAKKQELIEHAKGSVNNISTGMLKNYGNNADLQPKSGQSEPFDVNGAGVDGIQPKPICVKSGGRIRKGGRCCRGKGIVDDPFTLRQAVGAVKDVGHLVGLGIKKRRGKGILDDKFTLRQAVGAVKDIGRVVGLGVSRKGKGSEEMKQKMAELRARRNVGGGSILGKLKKGVKAVGNVAYHAGREGLHLAKPVLKSAITPVALASGAMATALSAPEVGPGAPIIGSMVGTMTDSILNKAVDGLGFLKVPGSPLLRGVPRFNAHKHRLVGGSFATF